MINLSYLQGGSETVQSTSDVGGPLSQQGAFNRAIGVDAPTTGTGTNSKAYLCILVSGSRAENDGVQVLRLCLSQANCPVTQVLRPRRPALMHLPLQALGLKAFRLAR